MLGIYALAVKAMQEPAINYPPQPQSWTFQAYMHAVPLNPFDPAVSGGLWGPALKQRIDDIYGNPADGTPQAAWKRAALSCWATCEHASPYFTTWHRWYLYYFERICRKLSGHQEFTLPYWNYASDNGPSLQLPEVFQQVSSDPTDPNPLYFDDRGLGFANGQATGPQKCADEFWGVPAVSTYPIRPSTKCQGNVPIRRCSSHIRRSNGSRLPWPRLHRQVGMRTT
jgi:tyrosinase